MRQWRYVRRTLIGLILLVAVRSAPAGDEKVELKLRLKKGETYGLMETKEVKTSLTMQDQKQESEQTSGQGRSFTVTDIDDQGVMTITVRYEIIVFRSTEGTNVAEYDSRKPPAEIPLAAQGAAAMLGQSFTLKLRPDGKVLEVRGVDEMRAAVLKKIDLPDGPMKIQTIKALTTNLSDRGVSEDLQQMFTYIPDHPVAVGDQWTVSFDDESELPTKVNETWTLRSRGRKTAVLGAASKAQTTPDKPLDLGFVKLPCDMAGTASGSLDVDIETGWSLGGSVQFSVKGTVKAPGAPGTKEPISCPMSIAGKDTIEPLPKK